jgi:signal transduction histidine kinase
MLRIRTTAGILLTAASLAAAAASAPAVEAMKISEIRALPDSVLQSHPTVRIRGVVTFVNDVALIIQDDSGGLYVNFETAALSGLRSDGRPPPGVSIGDDVEIQGIAADADIGPYCVPQRAVNHGPTRLPEIAETDAERFFGGAHTCTLVGFSGIVRRVDEAGSRWRITFGDTPLQFSAFIPKSLLAAALHEEEGSLTPAALADRLVDAVAWVAGPAKLLPPIQGSSFEPQLNVGRAEWFKILTPPPQPAFESPLVPMQMLGRLRPLASRGHRVRVAGVVSHAIPEKAVFLQDADRGPGIRVETASAERFRPGDVVEAAGFSVRRGMMTGLTDAVVRKVGSSAAPTPLTIETSNPDGLQFNNGMLVRGVATLLESRPTADGGVLSLAADATRIDGIVPAEAFETIRHIQPGTVLSVTGVSEASLRYDEKRWPLRVPDRMMILVRDSADIGVVRAAPWWTPARLGSLLGLAAAALAAMLAWTITLRRRLGVQTAKLAAEMRSRRDAAVEFTAALQERNRLAANLHDTILQTLGGIGFQLDACAVGRSRDADEVRLHFDVARRMVSHATSELRNTVWAMRSLPIDEASFPEAVRAAVSRAAEGHPATVDVRPRGRFDDVPRFVAGNLLLILQEAVNNALRHGRPRHVVVEMEEQTETGMLRATVQDDGVGFHGPTGREAATGHFGIVSMRERAERLGGRLEIASAPGHGTTVTVEIDRRDYDEQIDSAASAATG